MASIYDIDPYSSGTFSKNDVVSQTSGGATTFWYSLVDGSISSAPSLSNANWGGYTTYNTKTVPHFFWIPSYTASVSTEPQVDVIKFGDGYEQRTPQNISSELIKISLSFDKRDEKEVSAIAHFLHTRGAQEAFAFTPPSPYGSVKLFVCRSWDVTMNFKDNFSVKATFEEVVE